MSSTRNSKSKSIGLRILWIPGRKRNHHKGRYDSTNKSVDYSRRQKKSETWSLGGSKAQRDLLKAETNTSLLDGPSVSSLLPSTYAIGIASAAGTQVVSSTTTESTASTAEILPTMTNPDDKSSATLAKANTTTTVDIMDHNRFAILGKNLDDFHLSELPDIPKDDHSDDPNATAATLPKSDAENNSPSPSKLKNKNHRNHNHNQQQGDVNSIESLTDSNLKSLHDTAHLAWIDDLYLDQNEEALHKNGTLKSGQKELDQLDGIKSKVSPEVQPQEEDDKVVKCLYYTLMCCDCRIS